MTSRAVNGENLLLYSDVTTIRSPTESDELYLQLSR